MQYQYHSILILSSLVLSTLGMDMFRMIAYLNVSTEKTELIEFIDFSDQDADHDEKQPIEGEKNPYAQYSDLLEKEPQGYNEQFSWLKLKFNSSVLVFFLHFSWQNIFMDSMYTPPEA